MSEKLRTLLLMGVKSAGNYKSEEVLAHIEEQLTGSEYAIAEKFLDWVHDNNLTFGRRNIELMFSRFVTR